MKKRAFLDQLDSDYQFFLQSCAGLTVEQLGQKGVTGQWSVRDLMSHISWWELDATRKSKILIGIEDAPLFPDEFVSVDDFNAKMTITHAGLDLQTILEQQVESHRQLIAFLESVPEEKFDGRTRFMRYLVADTTEHYCEHAAEILAWLRATPPADPRERRFHGMWNVRDLGDIPTRNGQLTEPNRVLRADSTSRLSARGLRQMREQGVSLVIDLRSDGEIGAEPSPFTRQDAPITYRVIPLYSHDQAYMPNILATINVCDSYRVMLDFCGGSIADILRAIASAKGKVLYHCTSGKDRTGIISMMMLLLAGASPEDVSADYALSQQKLWPLWQRMIADAGGEENVHPWYKPLTEEQTMRQTIQYIEDKYGSAEEYLLKSGMTQAELDAVRHKLVPMEDHDGA